MTVGGERIDSSGHCENEVRQGSMFESRAVEGALGARFAPLARDDFVIILGFVCDAGGDQRLVR